jgi:hypothetical protein
MLRAIPVVEGTNRGVFALRRFVHPGKERCEFCRAGIDERHPHLLERASGALRCVCPACASASEADHLRVHPRRERIDGIAITAVQWDTLGIPVELAFLVRHADGRCSAHYPGPAGVVRSEIAPESWTDLMRTNPAVAEFDADVEALLVNRAAGPGEAWRISIDECYALAGIMRRHWRGLSGGPEVWKEIDAWLAAPAGKTAGHA